MDETGQQQPNFDDDPAAGFLAREQDELQGIMSDDAPLSTDVAPPTGEGLQSGSGLFGSQLADEQPVSSDPYSFISQMDETPECIRQWKQEQEKMLAEKDGEEAEALEELRANAKKELEDWYTHFEDQLKHTKESNRQAEEAFIEERDNTTPGHEWEKVANICDFNPKSNKNTKDVSRMRSMFLQLKQTPPVKA
ncbi:PREDICTED: clathrin light chain A-like [Amphimedon queenslandica]|uniref:Clathrin light chain n=1 Tax=Amphimedon queenslandica TaxID=400682 RepID=A0A1X7V3V9_AMPQE|nr:PREDICTED: clathrin light chain A-like [Amphimedon queenslandica]|eukprot:XP_003385958.1 PREDICTED: clathrin light chain A-like [Amphimedon queenslandica]